MRRFLRICAWIGGGILALLLIAVGLVFAFSGKIKQSVVEEVNLHLKAKVEVKEITFSVIEDFPLVSVGFKNVTVHESSPLNDSALAKLESIKLTLNFWDAVRQKIHIQGLKINKGYVSLATNAKGETNFDILKPSPDSTGDETSLSFQKVTLTDVHLIYRQDKDIYDLTIPELSATGDFKEDIFKTRLEGTLLTSILLDNKMIVASRTLVLNSEVEINKPEEKVLFSKTFLGLEDLAFELDGSWNTNETGGGQINIKTKDARIKKLLSLLPGNVKTEIENYESSGVLQLTGSISQKGKEKPVIKASFSVDNGSLFLKEFGEGLSGIKLKGEFLYSGKQEKLHISTFEARLMADIVKGTLKLDGFDDPSIDLFVLSEFNLQNLKRVADLGIYQESSGKAVVDISLKARLSELKDPKKYRSIYLNGKVKGEHLNLGNDSLENRLSDVNTFLELSEATCSIHRLEATWNEQRVQIRGEAKNFLAYLFNEEELKILGRLKADKLAFDNPRGDKPKTESDTSGFQLPPRIRLEAEVEVGELSLENFRASRITGRASLNSNYLEIKKLQFESCEGKVSLTGHWSKREDGKQPVVVNAVLEKVTIDKLFRQFNNFGQIEITDKNLRGKLSGKIDAGFLLDQNFNFLSPSLYAFLDIRIDGGELNNYEPLKALSRYVRVEDLENVRFKTLQNQIEIRDEVIFIPSMEIKNSAMNMFIEGQHSFKNMLNYSIKLQLKDVLAGPYMRDHEVDEFEKEEEGVNVFIRMSGTPDKLQIGYDSKKARKSFKQEMKKEKQSVKEILRDEFGIQKKEPENPEPEDELPNWEDDIPE
ncbi:MAG TPA: hypothetical protein DIW47_07705 [Bacteroidetes bacterium]|nr:hypothetical protein [Bacteroidota bacterium]